MIRGENSDSLPTDLIIEILLRLPAKSIARFHCVSKPWCSILGSPYFTDLFLTRSSARQRLLFTLEQVGDSRDWCFLTSPQPQNPFEKSSSLVVNADLQLRFTGDYTWLVFRGHASGLICFHRYTPFSEEDKYIVICNPSLGQFASVPLPKMSLKIDWKPFLGYDPIDRQYKVLSIAYSLSYGKTENLYQILTLGTGNDSWRKIHCPLDHFTHDRLPEGICINGVLYYFAYHIDGKPYFLIVCFDVRSEKFKFIYREFSSYRVDTKLINYKGKLGVTTWSYDKDLITRRRCLMLRVSVIKDVEKPDSEWSEYVCCFWEKQAVDGNVSIFWENQIVHSDVSVFGVTGSGEIVLSMDRTNTSKPYYVFYVNPERNTVQGVEIQGFGAADHGSFEKPSRIVRVFVDHIEDLRFMKTTYAETHKRKPTDTSTSSKAQLQQDGRTFESLNKFDSLRLLDDDDEFT